MDLTTRLIAKFIAERSNELAPHAMQLTKHLATKFSWIEAQILYQNARLMLSPVTLKKFGLGTISL